MPRLGIGAQPGAGFQVVVVLVERVELVQAGVPGVRAGFAVVVLDADAEAALDGAGWADPGQGDPLGGGGSAAEVSDDPADLTRLATGDRAAAQGFDIDAQRRPIPRVYPPP